MYLLLCLAQQSNMATSSKKTTTTKEHIFLRYDHKIIDFMSKSVLNDGYRI